MTLRWCRPAVASSTRHCQWPLWQGRPDGRYCGKAPETGRPYCAEHEARSRRGPAERAACAETRRKYNGRKATGLSVNLPGDF